MRLNPAERDPIKVADWVELEVLYSGVDSLSFEALRSQIDIDGTLFEGKEEVGEPEALPYERSESLVASTVVEIDRRSRIASDAYPFERSDGRLQLRADLEGCIPYVFCLLAADRQFYLPTDRALASLFEHLTREALAVYLDGNAVRFGAPRDTMPAGIQDAIDELARLTNDEKIGVYPVNDTDKDLGLDVAGWKDFPDRYISKLEVYMQCATGENWTIKKNECDLQVWDSILKCSNDRLSGLAIPYVVAEGEEWKRAAWGLLLMDRLRIASVLSNRELPKNEHNWWRWCSERIKLGREHR